MPFRAADNSEHVRVLTVKPANLAAVTLAEANAGIPVHDWILKSDFRLSPTASATHNDTPLGSKGTWTNFAESAAEGTVTVLRDLDADGKPLATGGGADTFNLVREKGTQLWWFIRRGPDPDVALAATDEYSIYETTTDEPQEPTDRAGYQKVVVPLGVRDFERFKSLVA